MRTCFGYFCMDSMGILHLCTYHTTQVCALKFLKLWSYTGKRYPKVVWVMFQSSLNRQLLGSWSGSQNAPLQGTKQKWRLLNNQCYHISYNNLWFTQADQLGKSSTRCILFENICDHNRCVQCWDHSKFCIFCGYPLQEQFRVPHNLIHSAQVLLEKMCIIRSLLHFFWMWNVECKAYLLQNPFSACNQHSLKTTCLRAFDLD